MGRMSELSYELDDLLMDAAHAVEEQNRKIAEFLDEHAPELAEGFRISTGLETDAEQ